jgi:hypothetical protein
VVEGHRVDDALEAVAFPVFERHRLDVAALRVARVEGKAVERRPVADVLVDQERSGFFRRPEAVEPVFVNLDRNKLARLLILTCPNIIQKNVLTFFKNK